MSCQAADPWGDPFGGPDRGPIRAEEARRAILAEVQGLRRQGILPDEVELDKLSRYEAALERSLMRTLHELQRLQAARQGGIVAPLALDVDFASS